MKLLADEDVDGPIVYRLREDGHEVDYVAEIQPGILDEDLLTHANRNQALLLTADKDFGDLVFRQGKLSSGVLLMRLAGLAPLKKPRLFPTRFRRMETR